MNGTDPDGQDEARFRVAPGNALVQSINDNSFDMVAGLGDIAIDAVTSGSLNGVPIVGAVLGMSRVGRDVRQWLYVKKVLNFLKGTSESNSEQRHAFVRELEETGKKKKFGEAILLILDRSDDMDKPMIIGKLVAAHIKGDIQSLDRVLRICYIVDRSYAGDIVSLIDFKRGRQNEPERIAALVSCGIVYRTLQIIDGGNVDGSLPEEESDQDEYDLTESGRLLQKYGLGEPN